MLLWALWDSTSSQTGMTTKIVRNDPTTYLLCRDGLLQSGNIYTMRANYGDKKNVKVNCDYQNNCATNCKIFYGDEDYSIDWNKQKNIFVECECNECTTATGTTPEVNNLTTVAVLGAVIGLLLLLLVIVSSILVWTCWLLKKRGEMKFNAEHRIR